MCIIPVDNWEYTDLVPGETFGTCNARGGGPSWLKVDSMKRILFWACVGLVATLRIIFRLIELFNCASSHRSV